MLHEIPGEASLFIYAREYFCSRVYIFLEELASVGIDYEVMRQEPLRLCGLEEYGSAS